eukprot:s7848_g1.t1
MQADDNKEKEAEEVKEQEKSKEEQEEPQEPEPKRIKKGVCLVSTEQKKYLKSLIAHGPTFRVEVYWTCAQPKCGVRCKETGKSMFCHSFPSFTILIYLCNELVEFFEKNGHDVKWDRVSYKANSILMRLRMKYQAEMKADPPLI